MKLKLIVIFFLFNLFFSMSSLFAQTDEELKTEFLKDGGSEQGYSQIIKANQDAEFDYTKLNFLATKLRDLMSKDSFDEDEYKLTYQEFKKEKDSVESQKQTILMNLFKVLSKEDRKIYVKMMYASTSENISESGE